MATVDSTTGLLIPTPHELADFKGLDIEDLGASESQVSLFLRLAADLLILRTGLKTAPSADSPVGRITSYGIMDLAYYLGTVQDEWTSMFSPFSSERIGSYSYSKTTSDVAEKRDILDSPLFNEAVKWLSEISYDPAISEGFGHSSEHVFPNTFSGYRRGLRNPSGTRGFVNYDIL